VTADKNLPAGHGMLRIAPTLIHAEGGLTAARKIVDKKRQ